MNAINSSPLPHYTQGPTPLQTANQATEKQICQERLYPMLIMCTMFHFNPSKTGLLQKLSFANNKTQTNRSYGNSSIPISVCVCRYITIYRNPVINLTLFLIFSTIIFKNKFSYLARGSPQVWQEVMTQSWQEDRRLVC